MSQVIYEPSGICQGCNKRKATSFFSEGSIAAIHGFYEQLCELCVVKRQLKHAEEMAAGIENLKAKLTTLENDLPELSEQELVKIEPVFVFNKIKLTYCGMSNNSNITNGYDNNNADR
jgi:hypothetical protein